jgi:hypothetical protein
MEPSASCHSLPEIGTVARIQRQENWRFARGHLRMLSEFRGLAARRRHPDHGKQNFAGAAGALARGYHALGRVREERATFGEVLAVAVAAARAVGHLRALVVALWIRLEDGDTAGAITELQESVTTAEKVFDRETRG